MLPRDHYLKQPFQDLTHFPNGFEKGGLSDIQARLVKKNGALIQALCQDEVSDATPDDLHILKVISNQSAPRNPVEQAWIKYLSIVKSMSSNTKSKSKIKQSKSTETTDSSNEDSTEKKPAKTPEKTPKSDKEKAEAIKKTTAKKPSDSPKEPKTIPKKK